MQLADPRRPTPTPPQTLSGRTVAGRYRVLGLLGQGGIGRVHAAEQVGLDRRVAVKTIRRDKRNDRVTAARFAREARAAGRISSPNVVTLYDFGCDGGEYYLAMELLEGESLAARLRSGEPMELSKVLFVAASIARGLRAAHEAGVLHRDLKPANIFLCEDGVVKVLDFGIAKLMDDEDEWEPLTAVNRILGTPVYMSPEAATRRPLGPTTDLYALGLIVYEMIVGEPPFKTGEAMRTLRAHLEQPAPRLRAAAPWVALPDSLDALVEELLRKDPTERPKDAGEVAERLDAIAREVARAEAFEHATTRVDTVCPPDYELDDADRTEVCQFSAWGELAQAPIAPPRIAATPIAPTDGGRTDALAMSAFLERFTPRQLAYVTTAATAASVFAFGAMLLLRLGLG